LIHFYKRSIFPIRIKMMKTLLFLLLGVLCVSQQASASSAGSRHLMNTEDDINDIYEGAKDEVQGVMDKFWGGVCISDDQCYQVVAFCDKSAVLGSLAVDGECRPVTWFWAIPVTIILLLVVSCICCIKCCCC